MKVTRQPHQRPESPSQWFDIEDETGARQFTARRTSDGSLALWTVAWVPSPEVLVQVEEALKEAGIGA